MCFARNFLKNLVFFVVASSAYPGAVSLAHAYEHPGGFHTQAQIEFTRQKVLNNHQPWASAWSQLLRKADASLRLRPSAIANFYNPGPGQDPVGAKERLVRDTEAAYAAALAYAIGANVSQSKRNQYADKAVEILNDWAYTNTTFSGGDGPLKMAYTGAPMLFAAELLWNYRGWMDQDKAQFRIWAANVLRRAAYRSYDRHKNNWGDWGMLTAIAVNHLLDDTNGMMTDIDRLKKLIDDQIRGDGRLPLELARDEKSAYYTGFSLEPMTAAIEIVRNSGGPNLYTWNPPSGGTVKDALTFYFRNWIEHRNQWPGPAQSIIATPVDLFQAMGAVYGVQKWLDWVGEPVFKGGTGLGWVAPTIMQPAPLAGGTEITLPSAPKNVQLSMGN